MNRFYFLDISLVEISSSSPRKCLCKSNNTDSGSKRGVHVEIV